MVTTLSRRMLLLAVTAPIAALLVGCSGGDNPKLADAPTYTPPTKVELPADIPNRKGVGVYGQNKKYQDAMERAANR